MFLTLVSSLVSPKDSALYYFRPTTSKFCSCNKKIYRKLYYPYSKMMLRFNSSLRFSVYKIVVVKKKL